MVSIDPPGHHDHPPGDPCSLASGRLPSVLPEKAKAGELFAKTPEIHKLGILADKLPK